MSRSRQVLIVVGVLAAVLVGFVVYFINRSDQHTVEWSRGTRQGAQISTDGRTVVLSYTGGACDKHADADVSEKAHSVTITIHVTTSAGSCTDQGIPRTITVHLTQPLGNRRLIDGAAD